MIKAALLSLLGNATKSPTQIKVEDKSQNENLALYAFALVILSIVAVIFYKAIK